MNQNTIQIINANYSDIKIALEQWIELYIDELDASLTFKIFQYSNMHTIIELSQEIENRLLNFLVNYLTYPDNQRDFSDTRDVFGFTIIKDEGIIPSTFVGNPVQIYVSKNDREFDNVNNVLDSGETYKIDFGGKVQQISLEIPYSLPPKGTRGSKFETIKIDKKAINLKFDYLELNKFNKRFPWISLVYSVGTVLALYFTSDTGDFDAVTFALTIFLYIWIGIEAKLLRYDAVFFKFFLLSAFFAGFCFYLSFFVEEEYWLSLTRFPLFLLILFRVFRSIYLSKYDREPVYDIKAKRIEDRVFSIALEIVTFLSTLGSSFLSSFLYV